jgi:hypothetical protein
VSADEYASLPGRLGVDLLQVAQDRVDRLVEAVQIEPVEARRHRRPLVVAAQPPDERLDDLVAPHPAREAQEVAERGVGVAVLALAPDEAVDPVGLWPVRLHGDGVEAGVLDQPPGHARPLDVELVRPVRCLADQHATRVAAAIDQRVVVARMARQRTGCIEERVADQAHETVSTPPPLRSQHAG